MTARGLAAAMLAVVIAVPSFAGDIVSMPTGNVVRPGNVELNLIYWNQPPSSGPGDYVWVGEVFVGVHDRLELDVLHADIKDVDNYTEVNGYLTLIKETPTHPSLIIGATNLTGEDWLAPGADETSFFVLSSYNLAMPETLSWSTPLVRAHLGWGDEFHGDELFAGVQVKWTPTVGAAWTYYRDNPGIMLTVSPRNWLELTAGTIGGDAFYRAGAFLRW